MVGLYHDVGFATIYEMKFLLSVQRGTALQKLDVERHWKLQVALKDIVDRVQLDGICRRKERSQLNRKVKDKRRSRLFGRNSITWRSRRQAHAKLFVTIAQQLPLCSIMFVSRNGVSTDFAVYSGVTTKANT